MPNNLKTNYEVLRGIEIPLHVLSSNKWRNFRKNMEDADTDEQVIVHLKAEDFPTDEDMNRAVNAIRSAAGGYSTSAGLSERGLYLRTRTTRVANLPDPVKAPLNEKGIGPNDTIVVCWKTRHSKTQ